ncbi:MAG: hypothetical protein KDA61_21025, partial [Planctomycetales bacterium]|nr:hypothetical protein [Planctomycetales bacterium]
MYDTYHHSDLRRLIEHRGYPSLSIYTPTHASGTERQGDAIQYRRLIRHCEADLSAGGMRTADVRRLLQSAASVIADESYWEEREEGLAVFLVPDYFECFRMPVAFEPLSYVGDRFLVAPTLLALERQRPFFLLAVSPKRLRLWRAEDGKLVSVD